VLRVGVLPNGAAGDRDAPPTSRGALTAVRGRRSGAIATVRDPVRLCLTHGHGDLLVGYHFVDLSDTAETERDTIDPSRR